MKNETRGPLADSIDLYLAHKRALGKQLVKVGQTLFLLDRFLLTQEVSEFRHITPSHIDGFVASRSRHSSRSYNGLLGALRGLFDWMVVHEALSVSPMRCESRRVTPSRRPFLFNSEQARVLLEVAGQLSSTPRAEARGEIYKMIFALLYGLGLRVGEVSRLCRKDVDLDNELLIIRQTKFGKDRFVPFGPKMASAIRGFLQREEARRGPISPDYPVFSFGKTKRTRIGPNVIGCTFHKLLPALQLTVPSGEASPHLHCLRHSFAVGTLLHWYRDGVDPMARLLDLSTFLGHVSPSSTAVYLTITTELLECASGRFAEFAMNSRKESIR
jgi:site-specific recombinase XerD